MLSERERERKRSVLIHSVFAEDRYIQTSITHAQDRGIILKYQESLDLLELPIKLMIVSGTRVCGQANSSSLCGPESCGLVQAD